MRVNQTDGIENGAAAILPLSRGEFEELARSAGFSVTALFGDYSYSEFREDTGPFMLWVLERPPAACG